MKIQSILSIFTCLICFIQQSYEVGQVTPTREIRVAALDQTSKSLFTIYFSLDTYCPANYYLRVVFPQYNTVTPISCWIKISTSSTWVSTTCTSSGAVNENNVTYLQFPSEAVAGGENIVQIQLNESSQLTYASSSFVVSTVNSNQLANQFTLDVNNNFGQIPWVSYTPQPLSISVSTISPSTGFNLPSQFITLQIQISNEQAPAGSALSPAARVKVVLDTPWTFTQTSTVTSVAAMGQTRPVISSYEMESPNQMSVVFQEYFSGNSRSFSLQITNIQNPYQASINGNVYVYVMDFNSNYVLQSNSIASLSNTNFPLTVNFQSPGGVPFQQVFYFPSSSGFNGGVFNNVEQHVEFAISSQTAIPAGYSLVVNFLDPNILIVHGSAFMDKSILPNDPIKPILYSYPQNQILVIQNLGSIPQTTTFFVTCRIYPTTTNSQIQVQLYIDQNPNVNPNQALFQSQTMTQNLLPATPFLELPTDTKIIPTNSNQLQLQFNGNVPNQSTSNQSQIIISFKNLISKATTGSVACSNGLTCTFSSISQQVNQIIITSPTNQNVFAQNALTQFTITGLNIQGTSNAQDQIFQIYACLQATASASSPCVYHVLSAMITYPFPNTNQVKLSIASNSYFSNINYYFPSIISAQFTDPTIFNTITPSQNQVRFATVFARLGLQRLTGSQKSQQPCACGANVPVTCIFMEGNTQANAEKFNFQDWDRVIFYLDDSVVGNTFRLSIPDIFINNSDVYEYVWAIGIYDKGLRTYSYLNAANNNFLRSISTSSGSTTVQEYIRTLVTSTSLQPSLQLTLTGSAGQQVSGIPLQIQTSSSFIGQQVAKLNGFGGAVIINTEWYFWAQFTSQYTSTNLWPFGQGSDGPISLNYTDPNKIQHFVTLLPLTNTQTNNLNLITQYYLDKVLMPYGYDLPNYTIYVSNSQGVVDGYNAFYNSGSNVFYGTSLTYLNFSCLNLAQGVANTYCTITFQPANLIQPFATIFAKFTGLTVATNSCTASQSYGITWIPISNISCQSSLDSSQLLFQFLDNQVFSNSLQYQISFYGVSIQTGITQYLNFEIHDPSQKFVIESKTFLITTTNYNPETIIVSQLQYANLNPYVYTSLLIKFQIPRQLYPNEDVYINLGKDLNDVNIYSNRFHAILTQLPSNTNIQIATSYVNSRLQLLFINPSQFVAGVYQLNFTSLRSPASNLNDMFQILFIRRMDQQVVVQNLANQTVPFPVLNINQNSVISLAASNYVLEGGLEQLDFQIQTRTVNLDSQSVIEFHYPVYYSPGAADFSYNLFCRINQTPVTCSRVVGYPYKIRVTNSPINVQAGTPFKLSVFGLKAPSYAMRYDSKYQDETLFICVDGNGTGNYDEYMVLNAPDIQPINNNGTPQNYIRIVYVLVDIQYIRSLAYHTVRLITQQAIPLGSTIQVLFPKEYTGVPTITQIYTIFKQVVNNNLVEIYRGNSPVVGRTIEVSVNQQINALTILQIEFQNVPTPPQQSTVDYNQMQIQVFGVDRKNLIVRSYYLLNTSLKIAFNIQSNYLQFNNTQQIVVTKGTYSQIIPITTSDGSAFQSNVYFQCTAVGFGFLPSSIYALLGTKQGTLQVGADKNLFNQAYSFQVQKSEKIYQPIYSSDSSIVVIVNSNQVQINVPPTIIVPLGGCSTPQLLTIPNAPFDELTISLDYAYDQYPEEIFKTDLEITSNILRYSPTITSRYISFCITQNFPSNQSSMKFNFVLGGINAPSYVLSQSTVTVNVIQKQSQLLPTLSISISQITLNSISINLSTNSDGSVYWNLFVSSPYTTNLSLTDIKQNLRQQIYDVQQQSDNLSNLYNYMRYMKVGVQQVQTIIKNNQVTVNNLIAGLTYTFCAYFETEFKINTGKSNCLTFSTPTNGNLIKAQVSLTRAITLAELNNLICFFVQEGSVRLFNLVDQMANQCSFQTNPQQLLLSYSGQQVYNQQLVNLYVFPTQDSDSDAGISGFKNMFSSDSGQIKAQVLTDAQTNYQLNFIQSSQLTNNFSYNDALTPTSNLPIPTLKSMQTTPLIGTNSATLQINQISLTSDGMIYFIVESQKLIVQNTDTNVNIQIRESIVPTGQQILNCKNYYGEKVQYCGRVIFTSSSSNLGLSFQNARINSIYKVYYVISNDYPITPTITSQVFTQYISTYTYSSLISSLFGIIVLIVLLI
ncbi:hypothetical protein ABPG74_011730 [Tetrahymena malaccensis]